MPLVEIEHLVRRYKAVHAVDGISLDVAAGEVVGILGPNGAGKTTLVETLVGLRRPSSGSVRLWGLDPHRERARIRPHVGVQLQESALNGALTVEELLSLFSTFYPRTRPREELVDALGLDSVRRTRFDDLSGGQQQRVSIALALVGLPRLVVVDELTTGLDPRARRRVWDLVEDLKDDGVTVILVSHAMDEVERLCDRLVLLLDGSIAASGTPADVRAAAGAETLEDAYLRLTGRQPELVEEEA